MILLHYSPRFLSLLSCRLPFPCWLDPPFGDTCPGTLDRQRLLLLAVCNTSYKKQQHGILLLLTVQQNKAAALPMVQTSCCRRKTVMHVVLQQYSSGVRVRDIYRMCYCCTSNNGVLHLYQSYCCTICEKPRLMLQLAENKKNGGVFHEEGVSHKQSRPTCCSLYGAQPCGDQCTALVVLVGSSGSLPTVEAASTTSCAISYLNSHKGIVRWIVLKAVHLPMPGGPGGPSRPSLLLRRQQFGCCCCSHL